MEISHIPLPSLIISIPHQNGTFVTVDTHKHPKSIVYNSIHSWYSTFCGFGQIYNDRYPSLGRYTEYFHCLKKFCALPLHPCPSPNPWQPLIFLLSPWFYLHSFSGCHIVGIIQYVAFSDWLLSFSNMHFWFLHVFSWLDSFFFFKVWNSIPWSGYTTVYLSIHLLNAWLLSSLAIMNKVVINICMQVFVWT